MEKRYIRDFFESRLSAVARGMEGISLDLTQTTESREVGRNLGFVISGWFKMKIGWPVSIDLEQGIKNLACGGHWILIAVA